MSREVLAAPLTIRGVTLRNRIVMSPMTRGFCPGGIPTEAVAAYYARRAAGGCALLVTEGTGIDHPASLGLAGMGDGHAPDLRSDAAEDGWRRVVDAVHASGAHIIPQLWHQGPLRSPGAGPFPGQMPIGPSGDWGPPGRRTSLRPDERPGNRRIGPPLAAADIEALLEAYARSARRAMRAGFDGIAIHGAHGYLIDAFLWCGTNHRDDEWGGDRPRRARFAAEVVRRVRAEIGAARPIVFRFSQWKLQDFDARLADTPEELGELLAPLAAAGVDVFDASVRYFDSPAFAGADPGLSGWAKRLTGCLSMTVGGIGINKGMYDGARGLAAADNLPALLRRFECGEFDLVAVGRALLGDPAWAGKVLAGLSPEPFDPRALAHLG